MSRSLSVSSSKTMKCRRNFRSRSLLEQPRDQHLQFQHRGRGYVVALDRPPRLEPFLVGRQRADAGLQPVGDDQHLVVDEQRRDLLLVGLQLVEGVPDRGVLVAGVLQFDHAQRQAVDEHHDVGPAVVPGLDHRELVDHQPVVVVRVVVVDQPHAVARDGAVPAPVLDLDPIPQHARGTRGCWPPATAIPGAAPCAGLPRGPRRESAGSAGRWHPAAGPAVPLGRRHPAPLPARRGRCPRRAGPRSPGRRTRRGRLLRRLFR